MVNTLAVNTGVSKLLHTKLALIALGPGGDEGNEKVNYMRSKSGTWLKATRDVE